MSEGDAQKVSFRLPCARCKETFRFRFPALGRVTFRCPKCKVVFKAEPGTVMQRKSEGSTWLPGRGLLSAGLSAMLTYSLFRLVFQPDRGERRTVTFVALNPTTQLDWISGGDRAVLIFKDKSQVAVVNVTEDDWILTRTGGLEAAKGLLGFGGK